MGELGAVDEDVAFDWDAASSLSEELRAAAGTLEGQATDRESDRDAAREEWEGRYAEEFVHRVRVCVADGERLAEALRDAADDLDELAEAAGQEQDRREQAREWEASQDNGGGLWGTVQDGWDSATDWAFGEDAPEPPPPVEPPSFTADDPGVGSPVEPVPDFGDGGVSSADPDDLDAWAEASRDLDDPVATHRSDLDELHEELRGSLGWGYFDASSLLDGLGDWVERNGTDAEWVEEIAQGFRDARVGAGTAIPDAVIAARLREAGLDGTRASVTFDDPVIWGGAPTSGYADDPVNAASGGLLEVETDVAAGGGLARLWGFERTYNSRSDRVGPFGPGWASWASARLWAGPDGAHWVGPDGQEAVLPRDADGGFTRVPGVAGRVVAGDGGLVLESLPGARRTVFDATGRPVQLHEGPGTTVGLVHDGDGRLVGMHHQGGRSLRITWDDRDGVGDRIVGLSCSDGRQVSYAYDRAGRLVAVEGGPRGRRSYEVDERGRLAAVVDADGVVELRNRYDGEGRVVEQVSPRGRRSRFRYLSGGVTIVDDDAGGPVNSYVHDDHGRLVGVVDGHGNELTKRYDRWGNPVEVVERDGSVIRQEWDDRARLVRREAPDGSWFRFAHDEADRVVEVVSSTGATTRFGYEGDERSPVEVVDPEGGVTRLTVQGGLVRRVVDPDGVEVRFGFDGDGQVTSVTDGDGNRAVVERDGAGRVVATVSPQGRRCEIVHDPAGRPVARRDPDGGTWAFEWSPAGRLLATVDPAGGRREMRYGRSGEVEEVVDELGHVTSRRFDQLGNLVAVVLPDGAKWELGYDRLARLVRINDPGGATWLREHDAVGNLVGSVDPAGNHRTAQVGRSGRVLAVDDGLTSIAFGYDELGRATAHRRPDGTGATAVRDRCGRITCVTGPDGGVTRYEHTPAGRLVAVTSPQGHVTRYEHDRCGRVVAVVDPAGGRRRVAYDGDGNVTRVIAPTGESVRFRYDPAGRPVARIAADGGVTRYEHGPAGRVTAVIDPAGGVTRYRWNARGELIEAVDPNGGVTRYGHDPRGLLRTVTGPLGGQVTYDYDPVGRPVARTDQLGRTTRGEHDPAGRLVRRVLPTGEEIRWAYDASGRVTTVGRGDGEPVIRYRRDHLGRPVVVEEPRHRHELHWDANSRLAARKRDGVGLTWRYDLDGRRIAVGYPDGNETTWAHDPAGRPLTATHPVAGRVTFTHDAAGRLTERRAPGGVQRWTYDHGRLSRHEVIGPDRPGDRSTVTDLERDPAGRVVAAVCGGARTSYTYDPAGQLTGAVVAEGAWAFSYDAAGRLTHEATSGRGDRLTEVTYTYDAAHQLTARTAGATTGETAGEEVTRFAYDRAGRRVTEAGPHGVRSYDWDRLGRLAGIRHPDGRHTRLEVDAFGDLAAVDGDALLWDPVEPVPQPRWIGGTAIVGDRQPWAAVDPGHGTTWFDHDWQGSVTSAGTLDPWGGGLGDDPGHGAIGAVSLGHRGEIQIDGLVWLRNRAYDPVTRQLLSCDPVAGTPGVPYAVHPYHYAGNDPTGALDPLGLSPLTDADLRSYIDANSGGAVGAVGDWFSDNWEYVVGGALIVGGVVVMATGVGGPVGAAMIGGGLMAAGASTSIQRATTGEVDWGQVAVDGTVGALSGGAGAWAGSATALASTSTRVATQVGVNTATNTAGGMASRGAAGQDPFDPGAILVDTVVGGATGGISATSAVPGGGAPAAPAQAPGNPSAYSVAYEVELPPAVWGRSRSVHFNRSNRELDGALRSDADFAARMDQLIPGVADDVTSTGGRATPQGWTWHHTASSQVGGRQGVMHLVPTDQHAPGSRWQPVIHPDGAGGYAEWAIPNGAPPN